MKRLKRKRNKDIKESRKGMPSGILWIVIVILFLISTQALFRIPAPSKWLEPVWEADGFIAFVGTITLGYVAIYQNIQAYKMNANMQKLEEARFVSMISLKERKSNYKNGKCGSAKTIDYTDAEVIELIDIDSSKETLFLYAEFLNSSEYPIIGLTSHIGKPNPVYQKYLGVKAIIDKPIYIPERGSMKFSFSIPFEHIMKVIKAQGENRIALSLYFENVFGYKTKATLFMTVNNNEITYQYRLAKFTDVKPNSDLY